VSRRKRRPGAAADTEPAASPREGARSSGADAPAARPTGPGAPAPRATGGPHASRRLALDLGILAAIFAATVGIAELAGAANLGVAIGIGQVTFAVALVALLLRA
jgi:hypothetical protein